MWYPLIQIYPRKNILCFCLGLVCLFVGFVWFGFFFFYCWQYFLQAKQVLTWILHAWEILSPAIAPKSFNWPRVCSVLSWLCKGWRDLESVLLHWYVTLSVSQESLLSSLYTHAHAGQMVLDLGAIQSSALERPGYVSCFKSQEVLPVLLFW